MHCTICDVEMVENGVTAVCPRCGYWADLNHLEVFHWSELQIVRALEQVERHGWYLTPPWIAEYLGEQGYIESATTVDDWSPRFRLTVKGKAHLKNTVVLLDNEDKS